MPSILHRRRRVFSCRHEREEAARQVRDAARVARKETAKKETAKKKTAKKKTAKKKKAKKKKAKKKATKKVCCK